MAKINILDSAIFNLISAGEVVENPASVVKELVENSIDSGATEISIFVEDGGIKSINIIDNGCGIEKEEIKKTVLPHATSKISSANDLLTIGTLGFRGEALASIAMVSEFNIKSKFIESDKAYSMDVIGGKASEVAQTNLSNGTNITVKNLFFNTPVRYRFLKSARSELALVTNLVKNFIFANPDIAFKYYVDSKITLQTTGDGLENAIFSVFEPDIANNLIPIEYSKHKCKITGFIAKPATGAIINNRNKQIFIVNGRIINDSVLASVVQNAYGDYLMKRTFPILILDLLIPFDMVDVNVHPNKKEVRFAERRMVNGIFYNAVKEALSKNYETSQNELKDTLFNIKSNPNIVADTIHKENTNFESKENNFIIDHKANNMDNNKTIEDLENVITKNLNQDQKNIEITKSSIINFSDCKNSQTLFSQSNTDEKTEKNIDYRVIGQLFDTYILIECYEKLIMVDQHATHERIIYDKLIKESENSIDMQQLLFPYSINLEQEEIIELSKQIDNMNKLGFQMEIHNNKLTLNAIPYMLVNMDIAEFIKDIVTQIQDINTLSSLPQVKAKLAKIACKKAIKGGDRLDSNQLDYVVNYFFRNNNIALQCPHGRPTVILITKAQIEKLFRRIV